MNFIKILSTVVLLHNISFAQSELADIKEEVKVEAESVSQAREKAIQQVLSSIVKKFGHDLLGEKKFEANISKIQSLISKESGKFAPVQKADVTEKVSPYTVVVSLKVSPQNLRQVFEKTGLLTTKMDSGVVLSYVAIIDQVRSKALKWWIPDSDSDDFLNKVNNHLHSQLKDRLKSLGFYLINPVEWNFQASLDANFHKDYYRKEDYAKLENQYKMPIVVRGQVDILQSNKVSSAFKIQTKLSAILTSQGKTVAESSRFLETEPGELQSSVMKNLEKIFSEVSQDLQDQLSTALQKGVLESSMIQIVLTGDLSYTNLEAFRATLLKNIGNIRYISEKSIESHKRVYDVDFSGTPEELASKISILKFQGFKAITEDVSSVALEIELKN